MMVDLYARFVRFCCSQSCPLQLDLDGRWYIPLVGFVEYIRLVDDVVDTSWVQNQFKPSRHKKLGNQLGFLGLIHPEKAHLVAVDAVPTALRSLGVCTSPNDPEWLGAKTRATNWATSTSPATAIVALHGSEAPGAEGAKAAPVVEASASSGSASASCLLGAPTTDVVQAVLQGAISVEALISAHQGEICRVQSAAQDTERQLVAARNEAFTWKRKYDDAALSIAELKKQFVEACPAQRLGKRYFETRQGLSMALRCCVSSSSAARFGLTQAADVARSTVNAWKLKLHASLVGHSSRWHAAAGALAQEPPGVQQHGGTDALLARPLALCIRLQQARCDATNSSVWRNSKLFACECKSVVMPASATRDSSSLLECYQSAETHRLLCDILPQDDGSAQGTHALICKQLRGVGALTPADAVAEVRARNDDTGMLGNTIHIFLFTTDSGSDQVGCQKMFITEVRDCNTVWCLRCPCFQHQYSLDAKESYQRADVCMKDVYESKHTYFASLAKLFNEWRAFFANIYKIWVDVDKSTAAQCSSKAPPRCLASRWGSAGDCEDMAGGGGGPSGEEAGREATRGGGRKGGRDGWMG